MANTYDYLAKANQNSYYRKELMKEEYLMIYFSDTTKHTIPAGESIHYEDQDFMLLEDYTPAYNSAADVFDYSIRLDAWYWKYQNKLFKLGDEYSAEWSLTDKPSAFFKLVGENFDCDIVWPTNDDDGCRIDDEVPFITCTFNGTNCIDALNAIVKALDEECGYYEWWASDDTIYFGKLADTSGQTRPAPATRLTIGAQIASLTRSQSSAKKVDRLYAYGSTKNLSTRYGQTMAAIDASTYTEGLGYQDPNHILKPNMFKESARSYQTYEYENSGDFGFDMTGTYKYTKQVPCRTSDGSSPKTGICTLASQSTLTFDITAADDGSGNWEETKISAALLLGSTAGGSQVRVELGEHIMTSQEEFWSVDACRTGKQVTIYEGDPLCCWIEINAYVKSGGKWVQTGSAYPEVLLDLPELEFEATTLSYRVYIGEDAYGTPVYLNPNFYQPTDIRAYYMSGVLDSSSLTNLIKTRTPASWWPITDSTTYGQAKLTKRLMVNDKGYVTMADAGGTEGTAGVEAQKIFEDIYPSVEALLPECTIKSVAEEDSDGNETGRMLNYYTFKDTAIKAIDTDIYTDDTAKINFKDNSLLNGMTFELNLAKSDESGTTWCIIPNEDYGALLPNGTLYPREGDTYVITGLDTAVYESTTLISDAQARLKALAVAYLKLLQADQATYQAAMLCTQTALPSFGERVYLVDMSLETRVIAVQHPIDVPAADYRITCSNSQSYKRLAKLENKTLLLK